MNMDRKAIAAIALCVAFLVFYRPILHWAGLDRFLAAPPPAPVTTGQIARSDSAVATARGTIPAPVAIPAPVGAPLRGETATSIGPAPAQPIVAEFERTISVETPLYRATFSNLGARLLAVEIKDYASAHGVSSVGGKPLVHRKGKPVPPGDRVVLAGGPLFAMDLGSGEGLVSLQNLAYAARESTDASGQIQALTFTARDSSGLEVRQTYRVRAGDYALDLDVEVRAVPAAWRLSDYSLTARGWPLITEVDLVADARGVRATSLVGTNLHREHAGGLLKSPKRFDGSASWAAVQSRYFIEAVMTSQGPSRGVYSSARRRPLTPLELKQLPAGTRPEQETVTNALVMGLPSSAAAIHRFVLYVGPSEYFRLARLHLDRAVDMGWTYVLPVSRALLRLLNWLYALVRNYGVAILLLATLVRVLLHPLNMLGMKSMRSMQKLQPELERIRAKYKEDPQAMNTAVMALYKENKVNPAGGCLPMLLQMPLFIALYQVLFNAIELRQAPFVAWIHDLSAPDLLFSVSSFPVRLMPIVMLGSGILAQRVTPSDPRQLPTMYMMNVMMLVFFYNLPSGLVFYWTIMNVLTALQQWMILRQDGGASTVIAMPAAEMPRGKKRQVAGR